MASLFTAPQFDGGSGITPEDGLQLFFFDEGTNTPKGTFTDESLATPSSHPVVSNGNGVFEEIWMDESSRYKVQLLDKNDVLVGFGIVESYVAGVTTNPSLALGASIDKLNPDTLSIAVADTRLADGDTLNIKERSLGSGGGAFWDVVLKSTVTISPEAPEAGNIVASTANAALALVLRTTSILDVAEWGAIKDTLSTAATQAALNFITIDGEVVINERYLYDKELTLNSGARYKISGTGIVEADAGLAFNFFTMTTSNVWIDGLRFKHNDRAVVGGATLISPVSGSNYKFTNLEFDSNMTIDIGLGACSDVLIDNCFFMPKSNIAAFAITVNGAADVIISKNNIKECDAGIVLQGGSKFITVSDNLIEDAHEIGIDVIEAEDVTMRGNIIKSSTLSGLRIGLPSVAGFPLAITKRVSSTGDIFNDCGTGSASGIEINSNDSLDSGGHVITAPIIRCASAGISAGISCTAANCTFFNPIITGPNAVGVNVQDRALNFKLFGGKVSGSLDTGVKLLLLSGSPVNADARIEISGVTIENSGDSSDGTLMSIANIGNSKITNNTLVFGGNTFRGFRFSGGNVGLSLSKNSVIGTGTMADAYSAGAPSLLDEVSWYGNKLGGINADTVIGTATILPGFSSISFPINFIKTPLTVVSSRGNEFVWVSAVSSTSTTFSRAGTAGALTVHFQSKLSSN